MVLEHLADLILLCLTQEWPVPFRCHDMGYSGLYFLKQYADQKYDRCRANVIKLKVLSARCTTSGA